MQQDDTQTPLENQSTTNQHTTRYSGLSGNEMYCAALLGYTPGDLIVGNSVFSMGIIGEERAKIRTTVGGELVTFTDMISNGRKLSLKRFEEELGKCNASGACGVTTEIIFHQGNIEFLSVGSAIHRADTDGQTSFTTSADNQELFCQWDAGFQPNKIVFGNVAYSIGVGKSILGSIKKLERGEVHSYSGIFNTTRNLALQRIIAEAQENNCNSVVGIRTSILPIGDRDTQEMIMIGTASLNTEISEIASTVGGVTTSDLTAEETWNIAKLGYTPLKLVLGTSVYSLGVAGGVIANFKNLVKGEISELTQLIYGAREESLKKVQAQAEEINADDVIGIKTYVYDLGGGMIEFLAIGTAVKKVDGIATRSGQLPPQAIIRDKVTFVDTANTSYTVNMQNLTHDRI
jgi:uncharacterized protein YbjQ (UPF0145 family)